MVYTRSQKQQLANFDPKIEQTARPESRICSGNPQGTVLHNLFTGVLDSKEGMAFVLPTAGQPLRESLVAHATEVPSCITYPEVERLRLGIICWRFYLLSMVYQQMILTCI